MKWRTRRRFKRTGRNLFDINVRCVARTVLRYREGNGGDGDGFAEEPADLLLLARESALGQSR